MMIQLTHKELLKKVFSNILDIDILDVNQDLKYQSISQWDSINHMFLINEIEETFKIEIDSDDIMEINSFENAKIILAKYDIDFEQ